LLAMAPRKSTCRRTADWEPILAVAAILSMALLTSLSTPTAFTTVPEKLFRAFGSRGRDHRREFGRLARLPLRANLRPLGAVNGAIEASILPGPSGIFVSSVRRAFPLAALALGVAAGFGVAPAAAAGKVAAFQFLGRSSADLFAVLNLSLVTWALLIFLPQWKRTPPLALVVPSLHAALYVALIAHGLMQPGPGMKVDMTSLSGVMELFTVSDGVFAGWLHYCVFDPLVGLGVVQDARRLRVPHFLVVPCLLLTMLLGPAGFLSYLMIRTAVRIIRKPRGVRGLLMGKF